MNWHDETIKVYESKANELSRYYNEFFKPRIIDINKALSLIKYTNNIRAVEIGCGDGRDAVEIVKRVGWYQGADPSLNLLKIAKTKVKNGIFVQADALSYEYPQNIDVIFAFASFLHINKNDLKKVFKKILLSLKNGGILYLSLKEKPHYTEALKKDQYGKRMFYYYNPDLIKQIAGNKFKVVFVDHQKINDKDWFTIALKKI